MRLTLRLPPRPGKRSSPSQGFASLSPAAATDHDAITTQAAVMTDGVTIYQSDPDEAIERLAQLDSTRRPSGRVLVAAVGGEPRAALPLDGGRAIADPFHRTAELVSLLELRIAQTDGRSSRGRLSRAAAALRRGRRASGGLAPAARALR
jgi:hypothetical protein